MAPQRFLKLMNEGNPITVYGDGSASRDFTFIDDAVGGIIKTLDRKQGLPFDVFNIGRGNPHSVQDLISTIADLCNITTPTVDLQPGRPEDATTTHADITKAKELLGFVPKVGLKEGLSLMVSEYQMKRYCVVVVVGTCDRSKLLRSRSLPSITAQTHTPQLLVVVDDSSNEFERRKTEVVLHEYNASGTAAGLQASYLQNSRTKGASGAWNTGAEYAYEWALSKGWDPSRVYIAILDDDDEWETYHLHHCITRLFEQAVTGYDLVACQLTRCISKDDPAPSQMQLPLSLSAEVFLTGNCGIQGSNLFVRLSKFLQAGMFDEYLSSCTDRDLLIRLLDVGVSYSCVPIFTVWHFEEPDRKRLSSRGSDAKQQGLDRFWAKWRDRMHPEQKIAFCARAAHLFGWNEDSPQKSPLPETKQTPIAKPNAIPECHIIVGIVSEQVSSTIEGTLLDLAIASEESSAIIQMDVFILENGPNDSCGTALQDAVAASCARGLRCQVITLAEQCMHQDAGFIAQEVDVNSRRSISVNRSMIQQYLHAYWVGLDQEIIPQNRMVAILDDDKRLDPLSCNSQRTAINPKWMGSQVFENAILLQRASDASSILGVDTDSPPLPAASCLRTQLVDCYHNLQRIFNSKPSQKLVSRVHENIEFAANHEDYYYDLSRNSQHLEFPFWFDGHSVSAEAHLVEMATMIPHIVGGKSLCRPLFVESETAAEESIRRGGITFIFDPEMLGQIPNLCPILSKQHTRRSDFIWCLLGKYAFGKLTLQTSKSAVRHVRCPEKAVPAEINLDALAADIRGAAFYLALQELLALRASKRSDGTVDDLQFSDQEISSLTDAFRHHLRHRAIKLKLNALRICGLCSSICSLITRSGEEHWSAHYPEMLKKVTQTCESLTLAFETVSCDFDLSGPADAEGIAQFVDSLASLRPPAVTPPQVREYFLHSRIRMAQSQVARICGLDYTILNFVGTGSEGVAFRNGTDVYTYMDMFVLRASTEQKTFLCNLTGKWPDAKALTVLEKYSDGSHLVLRHCYAEGETYSGGNGDGIIQLLRECRQYDIVCANMVPENLISQPDGSVKLVDYGTNIRPFTKLAWKTMARQLYLCCKWSHRTDLDALLSIPEEVEFPEFAELEGFDRFLRAVEIRPCEVFFAQSLEACMPKLLGRVLHIGSGDICIRQAVEAHSTHWKHIESAKSIFESDFVADSILMNFETIPTCQLLSRQKHHGCLEIDKFLAAVREHFDKTGQEIQHFFVCIPSPFYSPACFHHLHTRRLRAAGFNVLGHEESEDVETEQFEILSKYIRFHCRPLKLQHSMHTVSLLVKVCTMDWRTIKHRVRHIVQQLECPRTFSERVIVLDHKSTASTGLYDWCDWDATLNAVQALIHEGTIDRCIIASNELDVINRINRDWLSTDSDATHAVNGSPCSPVLEAFEQLTSDYILQLDCHVMLGRPQPDWDFLGEVIEVFQEDPLALASALNIYTTPTFPPPVLSFADENGNPNCVEERACLFHRARLMCSRPWPCHASGNVAVGWHQFLEAKIETGILRSYHGSGQGLYFVYPPNSVKHEPESSMLMLDAVERNALLAAQIGHPEIQWNPSSGLGEFTVPCCRAEHIFIVHGHNISPGRFRRCIDSILIQDMQSWEAIIVSDANDQVMNAYIRLFCSSAYLKPRITAMYLHWHRGRLANICTAVKQVCANPRSKIIVVDMDDCLLGPSVLTLVASKYDSAGVDVVVGRALDMSKSESSDLKITFTNPRAVASNASESCWNHLCTFTKHLFDRISNRDFRTRQGHYFVAATDSAMMLPMIEMAQSSIAIEQFVCLHEPSGTANKDETAKAIHEIVQRPFYSQLSKVVAVVGDASLDESESGRQKRAFAEALGCVLVDAGYRIRTGGCFGVMEAVCRGARLSLLHNRGSTEAILPSHDSRDANPFADVVIPTGLDRGRNRVVALADAVVVIGGREGTKSEVALAQSYGKQCIALRCKDGYSGEIADQSYETQPREALRSTSFVPGVDDPIEVLHLLKLCQFENKGASRPISKL